MESGTNALHSDHDEKVAFGLDRRIMAGRGELDEGQDSRANYWRHLLRAWHLSQIVIGLAVLVLLLHPAPLKAISFSMSDALIVALDWKFDEPTLCPQVDPIAPEIYAVLADALDEELSTEEYRLWAYESLGGAVRIPTETYDDLGKPGEDPRWETRLLLHDYLQNRFPLVHANLLKTVVNQFALVYHWQGTDASLKPVLLTAHQDVVPVDPRTADQWIQPPYSGYFDGEWIWGRGSCDDKSGLIASLTAVESLLQKRFSPARSVVLAYGIDEERGGVDGASHIRDHLLKTYGRHAFSFLVDEGGGYEERNGVIFSAPSVAEKGKLNVRIEVTTPGGHSSVPPPHTSIGLLSALITSLEANPLPATLYRNSTYFRSLQCTAAHDPGLSDETRDLIDRARLNDGALRALQDVLTSADESRFRAVTGTTQAVDLVGGGVKVNALPESAWAVVDHRIADHSTVVALQMRYVDLLAPIASRLNLSFEAFGKQFAHGNRDDEDFVGRVKLTDAYGTALDPAPISPTAGNGPWELLSGTILSTLETALRSKYAEKDAVVVPGLSLGNTDTRYYWNLTRHIFRYGHRGTEDAYNGAHTINEAIKGEGFVEMIRFFARLILNADETGLFD
ncbi:Metallo peptidase M20 [Heterobasidion irregulare TC 32-1]|uniref:Metallo peptidase M20 n=1 Tax=Heterobasidion irregulare (strain TC 32-1) TaxID=747525 RepID=W4K1E2_HETIT|nr:Metallo peptidase M20 [Heterobasidion irregulare TC 32-1]ETW79160.1 Metallo peptidase M20 [Heterobasidion irregulare TC 32-1]